MKSELNALSASLAIGAPILRLPRHRNAGRRIGLTPLPHRPISPSDRQRLRLLRERELQVWIAADRSTPAEEETPSKPSLHRVFQGAVARDQKWEFVLLTVLAAIAIGAVGSALIDSAQFVNHWSQFVQTVRDILG